MMLKTLVLSLIFFSFLNANEKKWIGKWSAMDEWQSEFTITIENNQIAKSNYADGEIGTWEEIDGGLLINWQSGKTDFIFNGVMGTQRLHKSKQKNYTSGIKKSSN